MTGAGADKHAFYGRGSTAAEPPARVNHCTQDGIAPDLQQLSCGVQVPIPFTLVEETMA